MTDWNNIREAQAEITRWASSNFPGRTDHHALSKLVLEEIPELLTHKKERGIEGIGTELADAFILLLDLASLWGVDAAVAIQAKMEVNYRRMWHTDPVTGLMHHVEVKHEIKTPLPENV